MVHNGTQRYSTVCNGMQGYATGTHRYVSLRSGTYRYASLRSGTQWVRIITQRYAAVVCITMPRYAAGMQWFTPVRNSTHFEVLKYFNLHFAYV